MLAEMQQMAAARFRQARLERVRNYADARRQARLSLPRGVFDYVDGGAEDEVTLHRNTEAFRELRFRPRMGEWIAAPQLSATLFGHDLSFPVLTAPVGGLRLVHPDADIAAARAANAAGTIGVASSTSGYTLEEIAENSPGPLWFQLYRYQGRAGMERLVKRAEAAGYQAIVATIDTQLLGKRERDWRNGFSHSMRVNTANALRLGPQLAPRPLWVARYVRDGMPFGLANTRGLTDDGEATTLAELGQAESHSPTWDDVAWVRQNFDGPVLVKGILTAADARRAAGLGCDGVLVSNHGGRQLDGAPASLDALPEIVAAVGDRTQVLLDGGVRRGGDVAKALALGARAVLVGRPYVWGLAIGGQDGVTHMLELLREELARTLQLMGCPSVHELDPGWVTGAGSAATKPAAGPATAVTA